MAEPFRGIHGASWLGLTQARKSLRDYDTADHFSNSLGLRVALPAHVPTLRATVQITRGGLWCNVAQSARAAYPGLGTSGRAYSHIGFRIVRHDDA